ncbi:MAG: T9SS type A sorting domain-containing protein [Algibacter sp.]|uniref:T9SS type A sorting domain-containing protein n=1 Tax=Algibacter sp. TaxID=1872428 RepID=UPI002630CFA0|nr:T9SS type A sorting domain-containing protein [Algibacter sp.]MDG1728472.1 T9SS type A sorting domain-containing protein [Algibacter sp.]MDG2178158.1 T9SS type A sorting domain-containing protein [Algibacter sp.]
MKKITLLLSFLLCLGFFNQGLSQDFQNENYDALTIGNVGTDPSGALAGQGGMFTFNGANSDYQIVNEGGSQANILQITGPATDTGSRFLWVNGLDTFWGSRTFGNDFIEIEFDFFSGPATTSKNTTAIQIYNSDYSIAITGFQYSPETKALSGIVYTDGGGSVPIGTYLINLGLSNTVITLNADTWYRIGFAFNPVTGEVIWKGSGFYTGFNSSATGINPFEVDFAVFTDTGNTVASVSKFDALRIRATATESLLGVNDIDNSLSESIKLYPNPATDVIYLSAANRLNLTKLEIVDINGRIVKSIPIENISKKEINISELRSGLYLINIYSTDGKVTKRIIKQ